MLDLTDWQNKKYTTRDGRPVRILCVDAKGEQPIVGLILQGGYENMTRWCIDGRYALNHTPYLDFDTHMDLFNAKTKREGWVNLSFDCEYEAYAGVVYDTELDAKAHASSKNIATIRIEWEE